jgi:hypothetical protein
MKNLLVAALVALCVAFAYRQHANGSRAATGAVESTPLQVDGTEPAFRFKTASLTPRAHYHIEAKLLSKERYRSGDPADLAPWDFAMGWGPMSHEDVVDKLDITQSNRFYFYHWAESPPVEVQEIVRNSANMHLIPANGKVEDQLDHARPGDKVVLDGQLVDASWSNGRRWSTSMTRDDTGNGACELMFVETVAVSRP